MKIINFGSLNIDKVYNVPHFVSAGETIGARNFQEFPGGKGLNQSIAAARAGCSVIHAGVIGHDGLFLRNLLEDAGVNTNHIIIQEEKSGHAVIQVNENGQNCIIVYGGSNQTLTDDYIDSVLSVGEQGDIVLLQNETNAIGTIMRKAAEQGFQVAFNPSPIPAHPEKVPFDAVSYLILNELEGAVLASLPTDSINGRHILDKLAHRFPNTIIVLTLGTDGVLCHADNKVYQHDCFQVDAVDTTAAGDTFCGYFLAGISSKLPIPECLKRASAASAIAVSHMGAAPSIPSDETVQKFLATVKNTVTQN